MIANPLRSALGAAVCLLWLCGCQVDLYSKLEEQDATAMLAELLEKGIACGKIPSKEGWRLRVDKADVPAAVKLLANRGLPKGHYQNMGDIFRKQGLISSPQEDRVRYIYALSQEISQTLSQIDGVLAARVHIALPENDPLADSLKPASASVFIKYRPGSQVRDNIAPIKQLVLNGVEGLTLDKVSVITLPGASVDVAAGAYVDALGLRVQRNTLPILYGLLGGMGVLAALVIYLSKQVFWPKLPASAKARGVPMPAGRETPYA